MMKILKANTFLHIAKKTTKKLKKKLSLLNYRKCHLASSKLNNIE